MDLCYYIIISNLIRHIVTKNDKEQQSPIGRGLSCNCE